MLPALFSIRRMADFAVYDHYDLLRTLENIFGVEPMAGKDREARLIGGVFR